MRHQRLRRKLRVSTKHRKALLRNLVRSLVIHKRIRTSVAKAKEASSMADRMVQIAKRGDLHARRTLISHLGCAETADTLMKKIAPRFKERQGGYTRVLKLDAYRPGDATDLAILEFTALIETSRPKKAPKKTKAVKEVEVDQPKKAKHSAKDEESKASESAKETKKDAETKDDKKESEKKGGFLGALRKFLKGDEK